MSTILKRYRLYLLITLVSFLLSAGALLAIPIMEKLSDEGQKLAVIILGSLFWLGLIVGIVLTFFTNTAMRKMRIKAYSTGRLERPSLPGMLVFSNDITHLVFYGICILGIAFLITDLIFRWLPKNTMFPILSVTYIAFVMHSIIDGKNYKAYKTIKEGMHND